MSIAGYRFNGDATPSEWTDGHVVLTRFSGQFLLSTVHSDGTRCSVYRLEFERPADWLNTNFVVTGPPAPYPIATVDRMRTRGGITELRLVFSGFEHEGHHWQDLKDFVVPGKELDPAILAFLRKSRRGRASKRSGRRMYAFALLYTFV